MHHPGHDRLTIRHKKSFHVGICLVKGMNPNSLKVKCISQQQSCLLGYGSWNWCKARIIRSFKFDNKIILFNCTSRKELCDVTSGNIRNSMVDHLTYFFYTCEVCIANSGLENFLNGSSVFSFYGQSARDPYEVCQIHHNFFAVLCLLGEYCHSEIAFDTFVISV